MTTSSIGSSSRDYATVALWWADSPANLVTSTVTWDGEMYNDSEFTSASTTTLSGVTTNATYFATLKPASGEGFADHANKLTNALRYNQANGVGIRATATYITNLIIDSDYFELSGIQLGTGTLNSRNLDLSGTGAVARDCICESATNSGDGAVKISTSGAKLINSVIVKHQRSGRGLKCNYADGEIYNCTIISLIATTHDGINLAGTNGTIVKNTGVFGFDVAMESGTYGAGTDYNATDVSSLPAGSNNQTNLTTADQFEDVSSLANLDLRAVGTGSLDENGIRDQAHTNDLDIVGQSRSTSAPTIGVWEVIVAPTGNPWFYYAQQ